jgi:hypothetical protein
MKGRKIVIVLVLRDRATKQREPARLETSEHHPASSLLNQICLSPKFLRILRDLAGFLQPSVRGLAFVFRHKRKAQKW